MELIVTRRHGGKTTALIDMAKRDFAYIVCADRQRAMRIWRQVLDEAGDGPVPIPQPITWDDFVNRRYYRQGIRAFVIDDLDACVQSMTPVPVKAVTLTDDRVPPLGAE